MQIPLYAQSRAVTQVNMEMAVGSLVVLDDMELVGDTEL